MQKNRIVLVLTMGLLPFISWAAEISIQTAFDKATAFLAKKAALEGRIEPVSLEEEMYIATANAYYIFNVKNNGGFAVVSGDSRAPEVLAYSLEGGLQYDSLPCSVKSILDDYASQVIRMRQLGTTFLPQTNAQRPAVPRLLKCQWGQFEPYNQRCPLFGQKAPTGCMATAMAQILYYHRDKLPATLSTTIPGYDCRTEWTVEGDTRKLHVEEIPAGTPFQWELMQDAYDEAAPAAGSEAVAALLRYCGVAVEMEYMQKASAANVWSVPVAMKKYFGFSQSLALKDRPDMPDAEWEQMIYGELAARRPVILAGETICGTGHVFLLDGIDEQGRYHLNWGWSGLGNGYFVLSRFVAALQNEPPRFTDGLQAVVGLEPGDGTPFIDVPRLTTVDLSLGDIYQNEFVVTTDPQSFQRKNEKQNVRLGFQLMLRNQTASTGAFESALALFNKKGHQIQIIDFSRDRYPMFTKILTKIGAHSFDYGASLPLGTYFIRPVSRKIGATEWELNDDVVGDRYIEAVIKSKEVVFCVVTQQPTSASGKGKKKKSK